MDLKWNESFFCFFLKIKKLDLGLFKIKPIWTQASKLRVRVYHKRQSWFLINMVPEIWSATDRIFMSAWVIFLCFTPLTAWKLKTSKKWKKPTDIPSFYTNLPKITIIGYTVTEIWCVMDIIAVSHLGQFFALLLP